MSHIPHGDVRKNLVAGIHRRAEALAKITAPAHAAADLDVVIAMFAGHLLETCLILLGPTFEADWASRIFDHTAEAHGICRFCHVGVLVKDKGMCATCWQHVEEDDARDEEFLAAEERR